MIQCTALTTPTQAKVWMEIKGGGVVTESTSTTSILTPFLLPFDQQFPFEIYPAHCQTMSEAQKTNNFH